DLHRMRAGIPARDRRRDGRAGQDAQAVLSASRRCGGWIRGRREVDAKHHPAWRGRALRRPPAGAVRQRWCPIFVRRCTIGVNAKLSRHERSFNLRSVLMHRETNLQVENEETIEAQSARTPKRCWTESN